MYIVPSFHRWTCHQRSYFNQRIWGHIHLKKWCAQINAIINSAKFHFQSILTWWLILCYLKIFWIINTTLTWQSICLSSMNVKLLCGVTQSENIHFFMSSYEDFHFGLMRLHCDRAGNRKQVSSECPDALLAVCIEFTLYLTKHIPSVQTFSSYIACSL